MIDIVIKDRLIYKAFLSRKVETRLLELFSEGKLQGTVHTCIGQEFSGAVISEFIENGDAIFSNHRCHGHFLSYTNDVFGLFAELMGKKSGVCGGWGGSQHLYKDKFFSSGIQGGILPTTTGCAFAFKLRKEKSIAISFIGDGTLGEGVVYETMNIASKWSLPLLIVLENNQYAQSTSINETLAGSISDRARSFDILTFEGDTWNWEKLTDTAQKCFNIVRSRTRPVFLIINTYRLKAHSKGDDNRDSNELEHYWSIDPLSKILSENSDSLQEKEKEIDDLIEIAVQQAEIDVYSPIPEFDETPYPLSWIEVTNKDGDRIVTIINNALKIAMADDSKVILIGEDVKSPYGGAFKVSKDLSDLFPDRVYNTPISESAIVGVGCGLAVEGLFPIVEIMFGDFITLTFDQILNHISKFQMMYNGQVTVNMIIRTPMGGGRGYGPTHSQSLEKHFLGIPGLTVVAINNFSDPGKIYSEVIKNKKLGPILFIENKLLYGTYLNNTLPQGFSNIVSDEIFPTSIITPDSADIDITIIAYGGLSIILPDIIDELFQNHDIIAQVFFPTRIYPFDLNIYIDKIKESNAIAIIEEGQGFAAFGSELIAQLSELMPGHLKKTKRISALPVCIPSSLVMEMGVLPSKEMIIGQIKELLYED